MIDFDNFGFSIVEMFYNSNLLIVVGEGEKDESEFSNSEVRLWDDSNSHFVVNLSYKKQVHGVKCTREVYSYYYFCIDNIALL